MRANRDIGQIAAADYLLVRLSEILIRMVLLSSPSENTRIGRHRFSLPFTPG
jgi:hypothetical protein